jgi:hypothetical protein
MQSPFCNIRLSAVIILPDNLFLSAIGTGLYNCRDGRPEVPGRPTGIPAIP